MRRKNILIIKVGDVVQLNSGGAHMTVLETDSEYVTCNWLLNGKLETAVFPLSSLKLAVEKK